MTPTELQLWINAHGQAIDVDGDPGPETHAGIVAVFTNTCAEAITDDQIGSFATRLGCSPKQLRAVAQVESAGGGFDHQGRPKILFERHLFYRFTGGAYGVTSYSNPKGGGYNEDSWDKLTMAAGRDVEAAFAATSWAKFQVLGAHACGARQRFLNLGYPSSLEMAFTATTGEAAHYEMLARYIDKAGLRAKLQALSTNADGNRAFAAGYNGPSYEDFHYHTKLAEAMR